MCSSLSDGIPGKLVMWAFTLYALGDKLDEPVSIKDWAFHFADGVPQERYYVDAWDAQKGYTHGLEMDNLLDSLPWDRFDLEAGR